MSEAIINCTIANLLYKRLLEICCKHGMLEIQIICIYFLIYTEK